MKEPITFFVAGKPEPFTISEQDKARFWSKVDRRGGDECWCWTGGKDKDGYRRFWVNGATRRAHRIAFIIHNGQPFPKGLETLHSCDNRPCCNPAHLSAGTSLDNSQDMMRKGRHVWAVSPEKCPRGAKHPFFGKTVQSLPGELNPSSKLTSEQVLQIRELGCLPGKNYNAIGRSFGVTGQLVSQIVRRKSWRHL